MVFVQHHSAGDQNSVTLCYQLMLVNKNVIFSSLNAHVGPPPAAASRKGRGKVGKCPSFCVPGTSLSAVFLQELIPPCVNTKCLTQRQAGTQSLA